MDSSLPQPGTPYFLRNLSKRLASMMNHNAPFDENIFTWILYCLAVGDKHLVLRAPPRDIATVQKTAKSILFSIFGLNTVSLRVRPDFTPEDLLAGLFPTSPFSTGTSTAAPVGANVTSSANLAAQHERKSRPRLTSQLGSSATAATPSGRSSSYTRGASLNRLSHLTLDPHQTKFRLSVAATVTDIDDDRGSTQGLRPLSGRGYIPPEHDGFTTQPDVPHRHVQLPHAVVVSGLESASSSVQETLWDTLRTRTVILEQGGEIGTIWNLPDGFILVYVSSLGDGSSRPGVQSALLDRISFNANVFLQPPPSPGIDPPKSPILRRTALLSREYMEQLQQLIHKAPMNHHLSLYISNLLSSIRYHPQLDASLVTSRCSKDVSEFAKASFVLAGSTIDSDRDIYGYEEDVNVPIRRRVMTPDDVKRIIKHVVAHRLNVREGVHEEVLGSLLCTAIEKSRLEVEPRRPVKDILNEAIAAV